MKTVHIHINMLTSDSSSFLWFMVGVWLAGCKCAGYFGRVSAGEEPSGVAGWLEGLAGDGVKGNRQQSG
jgi:hypothetical protein